MKSQSKSIYFHSRKCIWKCRLENGGHLSRPQCVKMPILYQSDSQTLKRLCCHIWLFCHWLYQQLSTQWIYHHFEKKKSMVELVVVILTVGILENFLCIGITMWLDRTGELWTVYWEFNIYIYIHIHTYIMTLIIISDLNIISPGDVILGLFLPPTCFSWWAASDIDNEIAISLHACSPAWLPVIFPHLCPITWAHTNITME